MLIRLHNDAEHLRRLQALLVDKLHTDVEELWEGVLDDLVKIGAVLLRLESVYAANGQHTLQARVDRVGIIRAEQLDCDIQEAGPSLGEVMLEYFLEDGNQLGADVRRRRRKNWDQSFPERRALLLRNRLAEGGLLCGCPSPYDAVLQVHTSYTMIAFVRTLFCCFSQRLSGEGGERGVKNSDGGVIVPDS